MRRTVIILLGIALLVTAGVKLWYGRLVDRMVATEDSAGVQATVKNAAEPGLASKNVDYQVILDRNLFGAILDRNAPPAPDQAEEALKTEDLTETELQLVLLGTVSGDERDARAIIVDQKANKQDIFQVGDGLQGAYITSIERGKVVLDVQGRNEVLTIKEREGGGPGAPGPVGGADTELDPIMMENQVPSPVKIARPQRRVSFRKDAAESVDEEMLVPEEPEVPDEIEEPVPPDQEMEEAEQQP